MKIFRYLIVIMILIISNGIVQAQPEHGRPHFKRQQMRERLKTLKIWQLTEAVELTSEQSENFFPIYNEFENEIEDVLNNKRDIIRELQKISDDTETSESEIDKKISELMKISEKETKLKKEFVDKISKVISKNQLAKYLVFEEKFKLKLQEAIRDIRKHKDID